MTLRIGTAAWALPRDIRDSFPPGSSNLERYAGRFDATEINSSFYRPHRRATYERWAASVPPDFRFAVKLPKSITHEARFVDCAPLLTRFAEEVGGLGEKRGPVLVQLPPSFAFDAELADGFFTLSRAIMNGAIVVEPRHPSWFASEAGAMLANHRIARVAADPAPVAGADEPGGWPALAYFRLHGSPHIYSSSYDAEARDRWIERVRQAGAAKSWVIFDNTARGAAATDALAFKNGDGPGWHREPTGPD